VTVGEAKAFHEFVLFVRAHIRPDADNMYYTEVMEEFYALMYRVNPKEPCCYGDTFVGVLI